MAWTDFQLTVTTPLFNDDDPTVGLRVSSVRGAMRFWFRALAGTVYGSGVPALARAEQKVFGSTEEASPVRLRLANQPTARAMIKAGEPSSFLAGDPAEDYEPGKWVAYLLGQGHAAKRKSGWVTTRPHTRPNHRFTLKVGFSGDPAVDSLALASLWAACTYGGFGARTRKGFGNVHLTHKGGPLPEGPWQDDSPDTPGFDHYRELDHLPVDGPLKACTDLLPGLVPVPEGADGPGVAPQPTLGAGNTSAVLADFTADDWEAVAAETGERYRRFRASVPHGSPDPGYKPPIKTPEYGTVIHGTDDRFPLGALGLPVNYKGGAKVTAYKGERDELRRASPLWFRFIKNEHEGTWELFSFAFHNPFLPADQGLSTRLTGKQVDSREVYITDENVRERTKAWMDLVRGPES
ncbi:type III-B CRISPR module RAMP protein Cmr1 [Nocardiopsis lambiniae]|uniref:Type III-B CRISPR module RAMP protein Cmr1 n=1 Tax=Nocardiopsis lambiniae TaxID=3075539 RepID=A0ABU2M2W8_9ACTN|nr:type III-B CRISPR module RAMP protein Cmr1 [Nocardiopsis sp. DSM 44743]MDT0326984.1 type III-B CRISPR module RAMP protein Cmr1 [Nocardiopsis sp. DSM 44743]